jgi:hypothetical protein
VIDFTSFLRAQSSLSRVLGEKLKVEIRCFSLWDATSGKIFFRDA